MSSSVVPVTNSHPQHIMARALVSGIEAPRLDGAHVLEIACGAGENLLPMAYWSPETSFTGFDSAKDKLAEAESSARELALRNIHFSSSEADLESRAYDYILIANIFSYTDLEVQCHVFELAARLIRSEGLVYVKYNTRAGWLRRIHFREILRELPAIQEDDKSQIAQLFQVLHNLDSRTPATMKQADSQLEIKHLLALGPDRATHFLREQRLSPMQPSEMWSFALERGLHPVAEMNNGGFDSSRALNRLRLSLNTLGGSAAQVEDIVDFTAGTEYREELLCTERTYREAVSRAKPLIEELMVEADISTARADVLLEDGMEVAFKASAERMLRSKSTLEKSMLKQLSLIGDTTSNVGSLLKRSISEAEELLGTNIDTASESYSKLVNGLIELWEQKIVRFLVTSSKKKPENIELTTGVGNFQISSLTKWQAQRGKILTNHYHELVAIDDVTKAIISELDHVSEEEELVAHLEKLIEQGELRFEKDAARKKEAEKKKILLQTVKQALTQLRRVGLLATGVVQL